MMNETIQNFSFRKITLFGMLKPKSDDFKLELMIGHEKNQPHPQIQFLEFHDLAFEILQGEKFKFYVLSLDIFEAYGADENLRMLSYKNKPYQINSYQLRIHQKRHFSIGDCNYYEKYDQFRDISSKSNNIFVFDLNIQPNPSYLYYKEPPADSITQYLRQIFYFFISLIEVKSDDFFEYLEDFIQQSKAHFTHIDPSSLEIQNINKLYDYLRKYYFAKIKPSHELGVKAALGLTCLFGILPESQNFVKASISEVISFIVKDNKKYVTSILELISLKKATSQSFLEGLAFLFVLEEKRSERTEWTDLTSHLATQNKNNISEALTKIFLKKAIALNVQIRPTSFLKIRSLYQNFLLHDPKLICLAESPAEFVKMSKNLIVAKLSQLNNEKMSLEFNKFEDHQNSLLGIGSKLPEDLSESQINEFSQLKNVIKDGLAQIIERDKNRNCYLELKDISQTLQELSEEPEYFKQIFEANERLHSLIYSTIERNDRIDDINSLELLHNILIKYYNGFLLNQINTPDYLSKLISRKYPPGRSEFLISFFKYFMTHQNWTVQEFQTILKPWNLNFQDKEKLIENLDQLYSEFVKREKDDKFSKQKQNEFITESINCLSIPDLKQHITLFSERVSTKDILDKYKQAFIEKIVQEKVELIATGSLNDPIDITERLLQKDPQNKLLEEIAEICYSFVPSFNRGEILGSLFDGSEKYNLLCRILQKKEYQRSQVFGNLRRKITLVIKEFIELKIEFQWYFKIKSLKEKKTLYRRFQNAMDLICNDAEDKSKLTAEEIFIMFEDKCSEIMDEINVLFKFMETYCKDTSDIDEHLNIVKALKEDIENKIPLELIIPNHLRQLIPVARQLEEYRESLTFAVFREKRLYERQSEDLPFSLFEENEVLPLSQPQDDEEIASGFMRENFFSCSSLSEKLLKILEQFQDYMQDYMKGLSSTTKVRDIVNIFGDVKDIKKEVKILSQFLPQTECEFLSKILMFINQNADTTRKWKGFLASIEIFELQPENLLNQKVDTELTLDHGVQEYYQIQNQISAIFSSTYQPGALNLLAEIEASQELIKFALEIKNESEIYLMREAVNDFDESHISTQTIFDFANLWEFLTRLYQNTKGQKSKQFLEDLSKSFEQKENSQIIGNLKSSSTNLFGIRDLYFELTQKEEAKRKQIFKIVNQSSWKFVKIDKSFDIELTCNLLNNDKESSSFLGINDLSELSDRARLIVCTEKKRNLPKEGFDYKENELRDFNSFCLLVATIKQIIEVLLKLHKDGYPKVMLLKISDTQIDLQNTEFECQKNDFSLLFEFKNSLDLILEGWHQSLSEAYKKYYDLTYLDGNAFWQVERTLIDPESSIKGLHLLHFIGKEPIRSDLDQNQSPTERLFELGQVLSELPSLSVPREKLNHTDIFSFYIIKTTQRELVKGLLSLYLTVEKSTPSPSQLLICHQTTSWSELNAFAFRCFFNKDAKLFCLVQPERLCFAFQENFAALIKRLDGDEPNRKFNLGFVTADVSNHLMTSLKTRSQTKEFTTEEFLTNETLCNEISRLTKNFISVTSQFTGLGKTMWIKKQLMKEGKKFAKIPISGRLDPIELGRRILAAVSQDNTALVFTIGSIRKEDYSLINEILFSLMILKSFNFKSKVRISQKISIYLEIDSSYFENLQDEIEIFGYMQMQNIEHLQWDILEYGNPKIQFVCNYLLSLNDQSLGTKDLTHDNIQKLSRKECISSLQNAYLETHDHKFASYTQLTIFIDFLYSLFNSFSQSGFFCYTTLSQTANANERNSRFLSDEIIKSMRLNLIQGLIVAARQFTSESVKNVRINQLENQKRFRTQDLSITGDELTNAVVTWEASNPFTIIFTSDHTPIFVYKHISDIPSMIKEAVEDQIKCLPYRSADLNNSFKDYQTWSQSDLFEKLCSLTTKIYNRNVCLQCFRKYERKENFCPKCSKELYINDQKDLRTFISNVAKRSEETYALTPDNFLKMLLIFTRIQQRIPVIIMGETGCGKTSLINFLCSRILDDKFKAFSIHAGIDHEIICQKMTLWIAKARRLEQQNKKLWIFFDEFNTTESIGLIKEIICERTMLGLDLPQNMIFLGACNPWRLKTQQIVFDENVGIRKDRFNQTGHKYNLLYTVLPLPETMIDYVWDYGHLDDKSERKYVQAMLYSITSNDKLKPIMIELILIVHQQFRCWEDVSSVSLRDVVRYRKLFQWFVASIKQREELRKNKPKQWNRMYQERAIILALLYCYYFRISSQEKRKDLIRIINPYLEKLSFDESDVEEILLNEENDFLNRMEPLPDDIARNQALRENVFALIVCILTKIPIFICGKPGCSKSLAVKLVFEHLRGKNSRDEYFRTLPELILVSYQGSEYCTSESITGIFNRAEKYLNINTPEKTILPVIVFDEIGLAEISVNNPLKVLHNKLELENIQVAFVAISNWRLDASKMNRALYLARPDPNEEDLELTAKSISGSVVKDTAFSSKWIRALAKIYCDLRERLKNQEKEDIFGLRDYYYLIKNISTDFANSSDLDQDDLDFLYRTIRKNLKKNFSGLGDEHDFLWKSFCRQMDMPEKLFEIPEPSTKDLIIDNLRHKNSRYLMLITESDVASEYIETNIYGRNLNEAQESQDIQEIIYDKSELTKTEESGPQQIRTLVGSQMPKDLEDQSYGFKVLSDIILYIEKGYTLIFKKVDYLYSSLYDLFNQSFSISGDKKYCRIALGALYNPKCLVHQDFHSIIFISEADVKKADPPFLNRFEKYRIKIQDILTENEIELQQELIDWIHTITKSQNKSWSIHPRLVFINYHPEYLISLILTITKKYSVSSSTKYDMATVLEECKIELIKTCSFDFAIIVSLNIQNEKEKKELLDIYYQLKSQPFSDFCSSLLFSSTSQKSLIYTYTQISETINYLNRECIKEIKLASFKSEAELSDEIRKYFISKNQLLVLRMDLCKESEHLQLVKHLLSNELNSNKNTETHRVMLILHLQRFNSEMLSVDTFFQGWDKIMFDSLNETFTLPSNYLVDPAFRVLHTAPLQKDCDELIMELLDKCFSRIRYKVLTENEERINERKNKIIKKILQNKTLLDTLKSKMFQMLETQKLPKEFDDWRNYTIQNEWIRATAVSPFEAITLTLSKYFELHLMKIVYRLEQDCLLDAFFSASETQNNHLLDLWTEKFGNISINNMQQLHDNIIEVDFIPDLKFPFSTYEHPNIKRIQDLVDEKEKQEDAGLIMKTLSKFIETSYFGEDYLEEKLSFDLDTFDIYFEDQLRICLMQNSLKISSGAPLILLLSMFGQDRRELFGFFLTFENEFIQVLKVVEALFSLEGESIYYQCLKNFSYIQEFDDIQKSQNNHLVVFENGIFYNLTRNQPREEWESSTLKDYSFLRCLFRNIIDIICSYKYLVQLQSIDQASLAFQLVEKRIVNLGILGDTIQVFKPWIDIIQFLQDCAQTPTDAFKIILEHSREFEGKLFCSNIQMVNDILEYFEIHLTFLQDLTKNQIDQRILKLQTQLYKNIVSTSKQGLDQYFKQIFTKITKGNSDLWRFSAEIIDHFDKYIEFSATIAQYNGDSQTLEDKASLGILLDFLRDMEVDAASQIVSLLSNKAFLFVESVWYDWSNGNLDEFLNENFETFESSVAFLENSEIPLVVIESPKHLIITLWLKVYLHFYSNALKEDESSDILLRIANILCSHSPIISTLKIFTLKNLQPQTFENLSQIAPWIPPIIAEVPKLQQDLVTQFLPIHNFKQFQHIDEIFNNQYRFGLAHSLQELLINFDQNNQGEQIYDISICVYSWFMKLYTDHYLREEFPINQNFLSFLNANSKEFIQYFGRPGWSLIQGFTSNFEQDSFFHLTPTFNHEEIHIRLVVLSTTMSFIAQQKSNSAFSSILFNHGHLPAAEGLANHIKNVFLFGQQKVDWIVNNMHDVKTNIHKRLRENKIIATGRFIYKCGQNCNYLYYFEDCGMPNSQSNCKDCKRVIGGPGHNVLAPRDDGDNQISMSLEQGLKYIDDYIKASQENITPGYLVNSLEENSKLDSKPGLKPITFRTLHFFLHSILFTFSELGFIRLSEILNPQTNHDPSDYFKRHLIQDYHLIQQLLESKQSYIWLYQIIASLQNLIPQNTPLMDKQPLQDFERNFETLIIDPLIQSTHGTIRDFHQTYIEYIQNSDDDIYPYIAELKQNPQKYPLLGLFNHVKLPSLEDFWQQFILQHNNSPAFPLLNLFQEKSHELSHLSSLPVITNFTNYLMNQFNYQISRDQANSTQIQNFLDQDPKLNKLFETFEEKWNTLPFKTVQMQCHKKDFQQISSENNLSLFLPNINKDESGILMIGIMKSLADLHNEFIYVSKHAQNPSKTFEAIFDEEKNHMRLLQKVKPDHMVEIDNSKLLRDIIKFGCIHHYQYGKSKEIAYDFERVEHGLHHYSQGRKVLNPEKYSLINYQFELYPESASIIIDIRKRIRQEQMDQDIKAKYRSVIKNLNKKDLFSYLGSLDYIFTYLCNGKHNREQSIEDFIEKVIGGTASVNINEKMVKKSILCTLKLKYILDLYEILEGVLFDQALQDFIRPDLVDNIPKEEQDKVLKLFHKAVFRSEENIIPIFGDLEIIIKVFKRLLLRVLQAQINLDNRLFEYFIRQDMWNENIDINQVSDIELSDDIKLKHSYILLKHLQEKQRHFESSKKNSESSLSKPKSEYRSALQEKTSLPNRYQQNTTNLIKKPTKPK